MSSRLAVLAPAAVLAGLLRDVRRAITGLLLAGILILALFLRLPGLAESLWLDELWSIRIVFDGSAPLRVLLRDVHPPLFSLLMFLWIGLFGASEVAVRVPALLFGLAAIPLVYALGSALLGRGAAWLATVMVTLSPVHIWYSHEARQYSALVALILVAVLAFERLCSDRASGRWLALYVVSALAATAMHYYAAAYVGCWLLLAGAVRPAWQRPTVVASSAILFATALFAACTLNLATDYIWMRSYLRDFTLGEWWAFYFNWLLAGNAVGEAGPPGARDSMANWPWLAVQVGACVVAGGGAWRCVRAGSAGGRLLLYLVLLPAVLLLATLVGARQMYVERSLLPALPFFYLVLAAGVAAVRPRAIALALVLAWVGISLAADWRMHSGADEWTVYRPKPDWRSVTAYLDTELGRLGERYPVITSRPADELLYYSLRFPHPHLNRRARYEHNRELGLDTWIRILYLVPGDNACHTALASGAHGFYLLHNRYWPGEFDELYERARRDPRCELQEERSFRGVTLYRFDLAAGTTAAPP